MDTSENNSVLPSPRPQNGSKVVNGILVVDGSAATAACLAAWTSNQEQKENQYRREFVPISMVPSPLSVQLGIRPQDLHCSTVSRIVGADPSYLVRRPSNQQSFGTSFRRHLRGKAVPTAQRPLGSKQNCTSAFNGSWPSTEDLHEWQLPSPRQPPKIPSDKHHSYVTVPMPVSRPSSPKQCSTPSVFNAEFGTDVEHLPRCSSTPAVMNTNWRACDKHQHQNQDRGRRKQGGWRHNKWRLHAYDWQQVAI